MYGSLISIDCSLFRQSLSVSIAFLYYRTFCHGGRYVLLQGHSHGSDMVMGMCGQDPQESFGDRPKCKVYRIKGSFSEVTKQGVIGEEYRNRVF